MHTPSGLIVVEVPSYRIGATAAPPAVMRSGRPTVSTDEPARRDALTHNEVARLFASLIIQLASSATHPVRWSPWRRRHQHTARTCHYQRQAAHGP